MYDQCCYFLIPPSRSPDYNDSDYSLQHWEVKFIKKTNIMNPLLTTSIINTVAFRVCVQVCMEMRGCSLRAGSCDTAESLWWSSCSPLPRCCGWDLGLAWTLTLPWSCCVSSGRRWALLPRWWRLFETVWCSSASGSCTCLCMRWVCTVVMRSSVFPVTVFLTKLFCLLQVGQVFLYFQWWVLCCLFFSWIPHSF